MISYIIKRLLISIPVLFGISILAFFLVRLVPGDTVTAMLGNNYTPERAEALRAKYGLDESVLTQYVLWLKNVLQGDFGYSHFTNTPVLQAILIRLPITIELAVLSVVIAVILAIPLGTISALKRNSKFDYGASFAGMLGISIPNFWLGTLMILFFSLYAGWFPSGGFVGLYESVWGNLRSMILPAIALGTAVGAVAMRMTRSSMLEVTNQDYIKMARAKGVSKRRMIMRHALKNALVPVVTVLGIQTGYLLGGSVVVEQIFGLPGVGQLSLQAITNRDYALLQGTILFIASAFVIINLIVDIIYGFLDPQIRY
ncbi:ABC transporter permease [Thalassobacillus pellis]|uniref:ABC transporter permease n=1 Tax=Thalassobacillus pellis TaxID=748008 RepID=UPI0019614BB9|nr:ABC transporter permease [Thalassobacillus pellis]MBM7551649.1 peptide/nickel transport system permease protein [Thalassobacillus pellis]